MPNRLGAEAAAERTEGSGHVDVAVVSTPPVTPRAASTMVMVIPSLFCVRDGTAVPDRSDGRSRLFVATGLVTPTRRRDVPYFNVRLESPGRLRLATSRDSKSDRTHQHSRSYLGPAIKRWIPQRSINVRGQVRPPPRGRLLGRQLMEGCLGEDFGINPAGLSQLARTPQIRRPIWNPVERGPLHPGGSCKGQLGRRCHEYRYWSSCIDRRIPSGRTGLNSDGWAIAGRGQVGALVPSITARVVSRRWASPTTCREPCKFQHWKGEETTRWTALRGN